MQIKFITNREDHPTKIERSTIEECIEYLKTLPLIGIDTENSSLFPHHATQLLFQCGDDKITYVIDRTSVNIEWLKQFSNKTFLGQNIKYDYCILKVAGIELRNLEDIMIIEESLGRGSRRRNGLDHIIERRLHTQATFTKAVRKEFINAPKNILFADRHIIYAAEDIQYLFKIKEVQQPIIDNLEMRFLIEEIEFPLIPIIGDCELEGLKLNVSKWKDNIIANKKIQYQIQLELDKEIALLGMTDPALTTGKFSRKRNFVPETIQTNMFGGENIIKIKNKANINYGSPAQIKSFLNKLGKQLPIDPSTKKETIGVEHLKKFLAENPHDFLYNLYNLLIKYSEVSQKIDAFGQGHIDMISHITNKIHTTYRQAAAATGRFQSGDSKFGFFNSQQILKDNAYRHCFYTDEGYNILTIDLASAELIILGSLAKDPKLLKLQAQDIHSYLATSAYNNLLKEFKKNVLSRNEEPKEHHIKELVKLLSGSNIKEKVSYEEAEKILRDYIYNDIPFKITNEKDENKNYLSYGWLRDKFKSVVYGLIYGATAVRISELLGITKIQANIVLNTLRQELPATFTYLDTVALLAAGTDDNGFLLKNTQGYVILNERTKARRWFPEVLEARKYRKSLPHDKKGNVEREAKNAPIQATNAFIIKEAIIRIDKYAREKGLGIQLLMQVHDELVYKYDNTLTDFPELVYKLLTDTASDYLAEGVSMGAAYHVGPTWHK